MKTRTKRKGTYRALTPSDCGAPAHCQTDPAGSAPHVAGPLKISDPTAITLIEQFLAGDCLALLALADWCEDTGRPDLCGLKNPARGNLLHGVRAVLKESRSRRVKGLLEACKTARTDEALLAAGDALLAEYLGGR